MSIKYKRVIIKISGEALAGSKGMGFDQAVIDGVVDQICKVHEMGAEIGIVVGGGNVWRGNGKNNCRPYGYACNGYQRACSSRRY